MFWKEIGRDDIRRLDAEDDDDDGVGSDGEQLITICTAENY